MNGWKRLKKQHEHTQAIQAIINVNFFKSLKFFSCVSTTKLFPIPAVHDEKIMVTKPITDVRI
jgi:hypothetical protein